MPPDLTYTLAGGHYWLTPFQDFCVAALSSHRFIRDMVE